MLTLLSVRSANAQSYPVNYFESRVEDWGFEVIDAPLSENQENNSYIEVKTNQRIEFRFYEKELVEVEGERESLNFYDEINKQDAVIVKNGLENRVTYSIPIDYLLIDEYSSKINNYFDGLSNSYTSITIGNRPRSVPFVDLVIKETTSYALVIFLIVALSLGVILTTTKSALNINCCKLLLTKFYIDTQRTFDHIRPYVTVITALAIFSLIRLASLISYRERGDIDPRFIWTILSKINTKSFILNAFRNKNDVDLALAIIFQLIIGLVFVIAVPYAMKLFAMSFDKFSNKQIKQKHVSKILLGLLILLAISSMIFLKVAFVIPATLTTLSVIILLKINISAFQNVSLSKRILYFLLFFGIALTSYGLVAFKKANVSQTTNKIFDFDAQVVFYPIIEILEGEKPFITLRREPNNMYPVFANQFLLYHPRYAEITNTKSDKFLENPPSDFYIIPKEETEDTIKSIASKPRLIPYLATEAQTSIIYVDENQNNGSEVAQIEFTVECANTNPQKIKLNRYKSEVLESKTVLRYPGCTTIGDTKIFTIPVRNIIPGSILHLHSEEGNVNISITNLNNYQYINLNDSVNVPFFVDINNSNNIILYSLSNPTEYFINKDENKTSTLDEHLNKLILDKKIEGEVKFYTSEKDVVAIDKSLSN